MYTIMIVDDEKAIRESLPLVIDFEASGFQVCAVAKNGEDALEKAERYRPDVVLLDVCMPILDGLGFLKRLHDEKNDYRPCVVMLSGYSDFEYARTAMRYGVKAYLTKPLEEEELLHVLEELKEELDSRLRRKSDEKQQLLTGALQRMYHDGDGSRDAYRGYFVMHCVLLHAAEGLDAYSAAREKLEERIPGGASSFIRSRGCVLGYLVSQEVLEDYQYSITLFGRFVLYGLKQAGIEAAALFDEAIFQKAEGTFRNDYDTHLYRMLTEIFWGEETMIRTDEMDSMAAEKRVEQEDVYLAELKAALQEGELPKVEHIFGELICEVERKRLNVTFIQEISYRIYYLLMDVLAEEEEDGGPAMKPLEWRDSPCFTRYEEWKEALWEQISVGYAYMDSVRKMKHGGIAEQVLSFIRIHFREQILLKDVAEHFYVTPAYLGRCVMKATGVSFKQYLNDLRMAEAKRLLEQTDKLVYEIAEEFGFNESKYFVSKFTAEEGKTPLEYRKSVRG